MQLPFDNTYAQLGEPLSLPQNPIPVQSPTLIAVNQPLADSLGIDADWLRSDQGIEILAGNTLPKGATPVATAYAGHQFGSFNPQLGDGRAVLLGELIDKNDNRLDMQLKGSGRTPWSRGGDGRSPLGPVLREYVISEAMAALGIPTTRALAAVTTGEEVFRQGPEPGGILCRIASSHIRVGTMQFFAAREDRKSLQTLVDYVLARHYPEHSSDANPALALLNAVIGAQAHLVARWQLLGFVHGVMNTDNMLLCGETVDYGPCAFMEEYNPATVFSSIDHQGRYAYANQPAIAQWNLTRLAEALLPFIDDDSDKAVELATQAIQTFPELFGNAYRDGLAKKLALDHLSVEDSAFVDGLFAALEVDQADFTLAFRYLNEQLIPDDGAGTGGVFQPGRALLEWIPEWMQRVNALHGDKAERLRAMQAANPVFIPRNHQIQRLIDAGEAGDFEPFKRLNKRLNNPCHYEQCDSDLASPAKPQERVQRTFCGT